MKLIIRVTLLIIAVIITQIALAQKSLKPGTTTIILLRHAEKDTINGQDPPLSAMGKKRAKRLAKQFPKVSPNAFYSTNFIRTKETVTPWSKLAGKQIKIYDAAKQPEFASMLTKQKGKTIVVVGHSNTIPQLVNLIIGKDKYSPLPDAEYSKIFIVTIKNGKAEDKLITY